MKAFLKIVGSSHDLHEGNSVPAHTLIFRPTEPSPTQRVELELPPLDTSWRRLLRGTAALPEGYSLATVNPLVKAGVLLEGECEGIGAAHSDAAPVRPSHDGFRRANRRRSGYGNRSATAIAASGANSGATVSLTERTAFDLYSVPDGSR